MEAFGNWGLTVARNTKKVFWLSLLWFCLLATGILKQSGFANEEIMWTPRNNTSIQSSQRSKEMFETHGEDVKALFETKEGLADRNILTTECFREMKEFQDSLVSLQTNVGDRVLQYSDLCYITDQGCDLG